MVPIRLQYTEINRNKTQPGAYTSRLFGKKLL